MKYNKSNICKRANQPAKDGCTKSEAFKAAWTEAKEAATTEDTDTTLAGKARQFKEIQRMIEELQAKADAVKAEIIANMNGEEEITADVFKIRYITVTSNRLDTAKLKKEHSDIYTEYLKESTAKRFTVGA